YLPEVIGFEHDYPSLFRLTWTGRVLDRRLLVDLGRPVWDSVAAALRAQLTDSVIDAAVGRMPQEFYAKNGADLARALRNRRDRLPEAAARFYELLAGEVDVHATDADDRAEVERLAGGRTALRLTAHGFTYYHRTFDPRETREIRLYLHGGDDRLVVRGAGSGPMLRAIGGGGDDELVDSAGSGATRLYDDRGANRFVRGADTKVDTRAYEPPPADSVSLERPRDWGSRWQPLTWVTFVPDVGLFVGAGVSRTGYGFRRLPYSSRMVVRAGYATAAASYRAEFTGEFRGLVAPAVATLHLRSSGIDVVRFHGFGNETVAPGGAPDDFFEVRQQQFRVEPSLAFPLSRGGAAQLSLGPVFKFAHTDPEPGSFLSLTGPYYGTGRFGQVGAQVGFTLDTRDRPAAAARGVLVSVRGVAYPAALDVTDPFGAVRGEASGYLSAGDPAVATLALRVGGIKVWGDTVPFHEAAFVGGASTVRGFAENRFAGDAGVYGNAELRLRVAKFFLLLPGDLGVFGLADVGRVYLAGESSDRWHTGIGGGVWFAFLNRANTVTIAAAKSDERTAVYVRAGFL
ncbi:MAG: BamA/TamA family outer membrane protein, partial [Candidatus Eiseniibacteriota bacterium]